MALPPPRDVIAPLSFQQDEMLRNMLTYPECAAGYDLPLLYELRGSLSVAALVGSLDDVVARHAALRTVIRASAGQWYQEIRPPAPVTHHVRKSGATVGSVVAASIASRYGSAEVLAAGPLFRPVLHALEPGRHILALAIHHLAFDAWSLGLIWRDLAECYRARLEARPPQLPALGGTYAEYARRQRERWPDHAHEAIAFWRQVAHGAPSTLRWSGRDPGRCLPFETRSITLQLGTRAAGEVSRRASRARTTRFVALLAATGAALATTTGHPVVLMQSDTANRSPAERELVGMFINSVLSRVSPKGPTSLPDHVRAVRETWLDAESHLQTYIGPILEAIGNPSVIRVNLESDDIAPPPTLTGLDITPLAVRPPPRYWRDLSVKWHIESAALRCEIAYRPARVSRETVRELAGRIRTELAPSATEHHDETFCKI
jgi:hypothetical protein